MKEPKDKRSKTLIDIIESRGYDITTFCKEVGMSKSVFYDYRVGKTEPTFSRVATMSKILGLSLKETAHLLGKDVTGIPDDK
jgi:ACT domain-containing protein